MKGVDEIEHSLHNLASPKRSHTFWGLVLFCSLAAGLLWLKHAAWLSLPNGYMLSDTPQGFKSYITAAWHVNHDSTYVHYGGMGYPYGDHILFADNQPIFSELMLWWSRHVWDLRRHVVGVVNLSLICSIVLGVGAIYLLLRKLHLPVWYAGLAALCIGFLSPQQLCLHGQFGLLHTWVLPTLLLLLCRYEERRSRRYKSLFIGILIWFVAQLHFYYLGLAVVFLCCYTLFQLSIKRKWKTTWKRISHLAVMLVIPYTLLNMWIHWSDYSPDRPDERQMLGEHVGHWKEIFFPASVESLHIEARNYIGLAAVVFVLWLVLVRRFQLFDQKWDMAAYHRVHKYYLRGIFFAGSATLLLSLGFPFVLWGWGSQSADSLGPFWQFWGLGRFAWAFYYVINVLAFYFFWKKSQSLRLEGDWAAKWKAKIAWINLYGQSALRWLLAIGPLALMGWEAFVFQKNLSLHPVQNQLYQEQSWYDTLQTGHFQAIMPLPYYHVGSKDIEFAASFSLFQKVQGTALWTGIPDMGSNMGRTSLDRAVKLVQWSLPPLEPPALLADLPDNRPIALFIERASWSAVQAQYPYLLKKAVLFFQNDSIHILSLFPDSLRAYCEQWASAVAAEMSLSRQFDVGNGWRSNRPNTWTAYDGFDTLVTNAYRFQGSGAGEARLNDTTWVWNGNVPTGEYIFSIWIKVDEGMGLVQELHIWEGAKARLSAEPLRPHLRSIVQGWGLFEYPFDVLEGRAPVRVFLQKPHDKGCFWYDEMLIREKNTDLYRKVGDWAVRNNYWHKLPKN